MIVLYKKTKMTTNEINFLNEINKNWAITEFTALDFIYEFSTWSNGIETYFITLPTGEEEEIYPS